MRTRALALALSTLALAGCKATPPGKAETWVITGIKHHITVRNKKQVNPLAPTPENLRDGKEAFSHYCVACHGMDGQNTGVPFADRLSPPIPSLKSDTVQSYTDGQLKWIVDYGIGPSGMPGSQGILSDQEIWSTILYIRHLPPAGTAGEPEMYQH
jgi:mono/diheme cytochrome c family protein